MKCLSNKRVVLRHSNPCIAVVLIGLPQFSFTLELREDSGNWEVALSVLAFGIFINWGEIM